MMQDVPQHWRPTMVGTAVVTLLSAIIFYDTWVSIVRIWWRSDTFTHGFLIIPISLWLIWTNRHHYRALRPGISGSVVTVIFACGLVWLLADLSNVQVIRQYAAVALLISALWMLLGHRVAFNMMMPLGFLLFMVPNGEDLIPPLMNYTANFTVWMLRLTGLSVYKEGLNFTLTSGNWSVVEGCSGLRYLIASITLGFVYAYLTYNQYWKRVVFVLLAIIVPIIANGFRAYMIVMIAHYSDMKLALGVDHYIYGGVFLAWSCCCCSFWVHSGEIRLYSSLMLRKNVVSGGVMNNEQITGHCFFR
nr:exosortase A [Methylomarinum sp. Ch1-1]MDP4521253.1 exosortase A [Methylomarinum sp. Ch1-1]